MLRTALWTLGVVMYVIVKLIPRRLLGSLSWHVDQFMQPWQASTTTFRKNSWFDRLLFISAEHPWTFLVLIAVIWACIAGAVITPSDFGFLPPTLLVQSDLPSYFGTAWSVQATVVALVYPLVISFVAFLLQRRATAKVALTAYLLETGVKPSGASSFALLVLMTIQYLVLPWIKAPLVVALMVANVVWLAVNLFLTGWFLARTAQYLQDERRVHTLQWLTQCVTLPREVRTYAMGLLLQNAQENGWVPGKDPSDDSSKPKVYLFPMGEGRVALQRRFSTPNDLRDVHFRPLGWAIGRWISAQRLVQDSHPLLELPCTPDRSAEKHVLCRVRSAKNPSTISAAAIRVSYQFAPSSKSAMPFTSLEVMEELGQEAASQAEQRREPGFQQALNDLLDVHAGLLRSASYRLNDDTLNSVCLLPNPYGWGSQPMSREWMKPYRVIAEAAVAALEVDERFFERSAALSKRLIDRAGEQPYEVLADLMLSSTLLMYHLGLWWSGRISTEPSQSVHSPQLLLPTARRIYSNAVQGWIGAWESIYVRIDEDEAVGEAEAWRANVTRVKLYAAHIDETARLLLAAVARGDAEAARRLDDSLIKWWGARQYEFDEDRAFTRPGWNIFTLIFVNLSWDEARSQIPDLPDGEQATEVAGELLTIILKKYWSDVCMVVALVLLESSSGIEHAESSLCIEIVGALMGGRGYDEGGTTDVDRHQDSGAAVARITRALFSDRVYSKRLDKLVERFRSDTRKPMTSGRVYSLHGADDVDTLTHGQAMYIAAQVNGNHDALREFTRIVDGWREDLHRLERISRHFETLATRLRNQEDPINAIAVEKLRATLDRTLPVAEAVSRAAAICEEASKAATETHDKAIDDAPLDQARLNGLALSVHPRVFSNGENSEFPLVVTADFVATDEQIETGRQSFSGVSKLPFTTPPLEELDDQLLGWFSRYTARYVFASALNKLQRKQGIEPIRDDHADAFYADLKSRIDAVEASGQTPIVLVAEGRRVDYLSPYRLPEDGDVPAGFVIRPPNDRESGFHALVNGIEVYAVPMNGNRYLVLPKEWLKTMRFQRKQVDAGLSVTAESKAKGKLDITFEFACEFVTPLPVN